MKNGKWGLRLMAGALGLFVSMAAAFFLTTYLGEGSFEAKSGGQTKTTLPLTLSFPEGVTPTNPVEVTAKLNNTTTETISSFTKIQLTVETPAFPTCGKEWLTITAKGAGEPNDKWWTETVNGAARMIGEGGVGSFKPGVSPLVARGEGTEGGLKEGIKEKLWLEFKASKTGIDQSACQEIPVKVTGKIS